MKAKWYGCLLFGWIGTGQLFAQGGIHFANSFNSLVVDCATLGLPVEPGLVQAGLYISADLNATQDLFDPNGGAGFLLVPGSITVVSPTAAFAGFFDAGTVIVEGVTGEVVAQALIWSVGFPTYADALANGFARIGASNLTTPIPLPMGAEPTVSFSQYLTGPIELFCIPEPSPLVLLLLGSLVTWVARKLTGRVT